MGDAAPSRTRAGTGWSMERVYQIAPANARGQPARSQLPTRAYSSDTARWTPPVPHAPSTRAVWRTHPSEHLPRMRVGRPIHERPGKFFSLRVRCRKLQRLARRFRRCFPANNHEFLRAQSYGSLNHISLIFQFTRFSGGETTQKAVAKSLALRGSTHAMCADLAPAF